MKTLHHTNCETSTETYVNHDRNLNKMSNIKTNSININNNRIITILMISDIQTLFMCLQNVKYSIFEDIYN